MDQKLFHLINEQWTNSAFDLFMPLISYAEIWTPFFLLAAVALLIFGGFRGRAFVFCTAVALGLSNLAVDPVKHAIGRARDRKSTRLNSSHRCISYAVFCLKKK